MALFEFLAAAAVTGIVAAELGRLTSKRHCGVLMTVVVVMVVIAIWTVHMFGRLLSGHGELSELIERSAEWAAL